MQSTDRQREELLALASKKGWEISEDKIYVDIISGFKAGEVRPYKIYNCKMTLMS